MTRAITLIFYLFVAGSGGTSTQVPREREEAIKKRFFDFDGQLRSFPAERGRLSNGATDTGHGADNPPAREQNGDMRNFLIHWLITALALALAARLVSGIHVGSLAGLAVASLVLGLVNAFVRPVLVLLTLPVTILTLGLFYLVVNGAAFGLAAALVPGFTVASFGSAIAGALIVSLVSWALGWILRPRIEAT
jgi:putative membrane protein